MSSIQRLKPTAPAIETQAPAPAAAGRGNAAVQMKAALAGLGFEAQAEALRPPSESSATAQPSSAVQRKAAGPPVQMDKNFDAVTKSGMKEADAPADITLPKEVKKGMQESWDASLPGGKSQEQGGNVVRNKDGSYGWRQGKAGTSGTFTPDYGDVGADQEMIGIGHTHPYSKAEGGHTDVSFSGGDLSSIVWESQPLNLVQSGETLFVVARTAEFEKLVAGKDQPAKQKLADEIEKTWDDKFAAEGPKGVVAAAEAATKATCAKYHLVYYKGKGETLSKVDTSK